MRSQRAKKAAKTRAKNTRKRASMSKARSAKELSDKTLIEKCAKAYSDMESHVSDLVNMGTIAMDQFDKNEGLFIFAVGKLEDMLNEFKAHYYAKEFPT
jgi:hypothetical protein